MRPISLALTLSAVARLRDHEVGFEEGLRKEASEKDRNEVAAGVVGSGLGVLKCGVLCVVAWLSSGATVAGTCDCGDGYEVGMFVVVQLW